MKKVYLDVQIKKKQLKMEMNSGISVEALGEFCQYFPKLEIQKTLTGSKSYSQHDLQVKGCVNENVSFKDST